MIAIDIGCGRKKMAGSVGIDFSALSDADIVLDLNCEKLPFDDNSVDFAFSSHALEHLTLDGFFNVLGEVYRVLKPGGQFKLVVPYFTTMPNLANPFHNNNICFNEHTFRFFSSDMETDALPKYQYQTPSCGHWGLRYSANSELGIEFKTRKIGFFYFPEYRDLDEKDRFAARASKTNVVEQIIYTLEPVKPCPVRPEMGPVASNDDPHEFVGGQIAHLKGQVEYLAARNVEGPDIEVAREYATQTERIGDCYQTGGVLTPVNFFVYELDDFIQRLRHIIDSLQ
jgi:SAM-dependent methyltransferase